MTVGIRRSFQLRDRTANHGQSGLLQSTEQDRPVASETVSVHGVKAFDRLAIEPADDPRAPGGPSERLPDGVDASGLDVESVQRSPPFRNRPRSDTFFRIRNRTHATFGLRHEPTE